METTSATGEDFTHGSETGHGLFFVFFLSSLKKNGFLLFQGLLLPKTASSAQDVGLQNGQPAQVHWEKSDRGDPV